MRCDNGELTYGPAVSVGHHCAESMRTWLFFALIMNGRLQNFRFAPDTPQIALPVLVARQISRSVLYMAHFTFMYSAFACFNIRSPGSACFHKVKKPSYTF
jgi:hypothetical protein